MRVTKIRPAAALAAVALLAACSETTGPGALARQAGVLQLAGHPAASESTIDRDVHWTGDPAPPDVLTAEQVLQAPAVVQAGTPFTVVVTTIGPEGCWSAHSQDVQVSGRVVELKPYDVHSGAEVCTRILLYLRHESQITLTQPGEYTLRVTGRRARHGDAEWETPVAAEKTLIVQ